MGSVGTNSGKFLKFVDTFRENTLILLKYGGSELLQTDRSIVVAHPPPRADHLRPRCTGKRSKGRKSFEKRRIFLQDAAHLCLLEHNLGDENTVRIKFLSPG
jgi:hypothetical protein